MFTTKIKTTISKMSAWPIMVLIVAMMGVLHLSGASAALPQVGTAHASASDSSTCLRWCNGLAASKLTSEEQEIQEKEPIPPLIGFGALIAAVFVGANLIRKQRLYIDTIPIFKQVACYRI